MTDAAPFLLAPGIDVEAAAKGFRSRGRVRIDPILAPEMAARLHQALAREADWSLAFNAGDAVRRLGPEDMAALAAPQREAILAVIHGGARAGFQFVYSLIPILGDYFDRSAPDSLLLELFEWLNGEAFLGAMRAVTGLSAIAWADAQATRFRAGQFLTAHSDLSAGEERLAAFVLNLTPEWDRGWGGYLHFFDSAGDIEQGLRPGFNQLSLFAVPTPHAVQQLTSWCPASRYAITGWLRGDPPPADLGWRSARR